MYYAYRLDNVLNGKMYFGHTDANPKSFTFEQLLNFAQGIKDLRHLYNSMKKYGDKAFKLSVLNFYNDENDAVEFIVKKIIMCHTDSPAHGYNNNGAELIPNYMYTKKENPTVPKEKEATTTIAEKDPIDVINAATESLTKMRGYIRAKDFTKFFAEYVYFNSIIYVTGVYDHFGLAMDGMAGTLFEICRDCLSVYIKEHLKIR